MIEYKPRKSAMKGGRAAWRLQQSEGDATRSGSMVELVTDTTERNKSLKSPVTSRKLYLKTFMTQRSLEKGTLRVESEESLFSTAIDATASSSVTSSSTVDSIAVDEKESHDLGSLKIPFTLPAAGKSLNINTDISSSQSSEDSKALSDDGERLVDSI
jgi:hypothetical protein